MEVSQNRPIPSYHPYFHRIFHHRLIRFLPRRPLQPPVPQAPRWSAPAAQLARALCRGPPQCPSAQQAPELVERNGAWCCSKPKNGGGSCIKYMGHFTREDVLWKSPAWSKGVSQNGRWNLENDDHWIREWPTLQTSPLWRMQNDFACFPICIMIGIMSGRSWLWFCGWRTLDEDVPGEVSSIHEILGWSGLGIARAGCQVGTGKDWRLKNEHPEIRWRSLGHPEIFGSLSSSACVKDLSIVATCQFPHSKVAWNWECSVLKRLRHANIGGPQAMWTAAPASA